MFIYCVLVTFLVFSHISNISVFYKKVSLAEEEQFFKMISNAQSGRLEDQRCVLPPSRSTHATPTHNRTALNNNTGQLCIVCS